MIARTESAGPAAARRPRLIDLRGDRLGLPTARNVRDAAKRALDDGETHYTTRPGLNPLRRAIAEKLKRDNGIRVHPEPEVLVTCGTREALFVAFHVLLERGDEIVVTGPAPKLYRDVARLAGGRARVVAGDPGDGFALDAGEIARRLTPRTSNRSRLSLEPGRRCRGRRSPRRAEAGLAISRGPRGRLGRDPRALRLRQAPSTAVSARCRDGRADGDDQRLLRGVRPRGLAGRVHGRARVAARADDPAQAGDEHLQRGRVPARCARGRHRSRSRLPRAMLVAERRERTFAALAACRFARPRPATTCSSIPGPPVPNGSLEQALRDARLRVGEAPKYGAPGWLSLALTSPSEDLEGPQSVSARSSPHRRRHARWLRPWRRASPTTSWSAWTTRERGSATTCWSVPSR